MSNYLIARQNSRVISGDDKIFGINKLAKEMGEKIGSENVTNATIGAFLDDNGKLMVMPTVIDVLKNLEPSEYAEYAPITGRADFLKVCQEAVFGDFVPEGYIEAVATPGGTGAVRNSIQNYSSPGDSVLTSSWFWSPYTTIADELGRKIETYEMFTSESKFNTTSFSSKIDEILKKQDNLVILFNAPAHNPTGFSPSSEDWDNVVSALKTAVKGKSKNIIFVVDAAYIDFAGDPIESRKFFTKFNNLPENLLLFTAFSMSKSYTLYGMRSGALICISKSKEIAEEFKRVNAFSNRGTWSNGTNSAMVLLSKIFNNDTILKKVNEERDAFNNIMTNRGIAFIEAAKKYNVPTCPFNAGFFITMPCENADAVGAELQKDAIFSVPIGKGLRFAISSVSIDQCAAAPAKIANAIQKYK